MVEDLKRTPSPPAGILIELNRAVKAFTLYPRGHPALKETLHRTYGTCLGILKGLEEITFSVKREGFYLDGAPLPSSPSLKNLAKDLFYKRIEAITLTTSMTEDEWARFLGLLSLGSAEITARGGIMKLLLEEEIRGIRVNETRYEDLLKGSLEEMEEGEKGIEEEERDEKGGVDARIEELVEGLQDRFESEEEREEEDLDSLLKALEEEKDPIRYEGLVRSLVVRGVELRDKGMWEETFKILKAFSRHALSKRKEAMVDSARQGLRELFNEEVEEECFRRLAIKDEEANRDITRIILAMGEEMVEPCLKRLEEEERIYPRRCLFNIVVAFGEKARSKVEERLREARQWYIKRQMISLLGAIGNPDSLRVLKEVLCDEDIRVRKEAVKALAGIRSEEAVDMLIDFVGSKDQALSLQAIASLGAIRASRAVPHLVSLIEMRGLSANLYERKKAAIKALGSIGDERAIPALGNLLKRKGIIRRKRLNELKSLCAIALSSIGGKGAEETLREVMERSRGDLYYACLNGLERMKRG